MLSFFRSIRQSLLNEGKTWKYMKYAVGEFLLIVAGILVALQIQTWNENRKLAQDRRELIENLIEEFQANLAELDEIIETTLEIGAVPVFVYMPWGEELTADASSLVEWEAFMLDYCKTQAELHCLTLRPDFAAGIADGIEYAHFHWKVPGNVTAAEGIYSYLIENKLVE